MFLNDNLSLILIIFIFSISIYLINNPPIIDHFNMCELNNKNEEDCNKTLLCKWNNNKCDYRYKLPGVPKII